MGNHPDGEVVDRGLSPSLEQYRARAVFAALSVVSTGAVFFSVLNLICVVVLSIRSFLECI